MAKNENDIFEILANGTIDDLARELSEGTWTETSQDGVRKLINADGTIELCEF